MRKILLIFYILMLCEFGLQAQELQARLSINSSRLSTQVDRKIFQTLQNALNNFLNNRKWTKDAYLQNEKISCNFLLNIAAADINNIFRASLTVQVARPIYNTSYDSPIINFIDDNVSFRYVEFQPIEFNENRVSGNDPVAGNLTAILAYYVYIILGLDGDSYSLRGGDAHFQKAQNIVNNAPDGRDLAGWKAFDGQRNRFWLMDNLTNSRFALVHDAIYSYYKLGLDNMYDNETEAVTAITNSINLMNNINTDIPNSMIMQFFFQPKSSELINIFKKSPQDEKSRIVDLLIKLDVTNANMYKQELK